MYLFDEIDHMSKMQRDKGAQFEREIATMLSVRRNLGQARDGGADITIPGWQIECKRRAKIAVYEWINQCLDACDFMDRALVIARADNELPIAILHFSDFLDLIGQPSTPEAHQSADEAPPSPGAAQVRCAAEASVMPTASTHKKGDIT
jgi:hypothetical protein